MDIEKSPQGRAKAAGLLSPPTRDLRMNEPRFHSTIPEPPNFVVVAGAPQFFGHNPLVVRTGALAPPIISRASSSLPATKLAEFWFSIS
jgi:hypothetical protein